MLAIIIQPLSYKFFFVIIVKRGYQICHIDIVTAFLYNFLNKIIYAEHLYLFVIEFKKIFKLITVLYELKQVLYVWYKTLIKFLKKLRFTQLKLDHKIFMLAKKWLFIVIHFDNLFIVGSDIPCSENIQQKL